MKLEIFNHWWKSGRVKKEFSPKYKRKLFYEIIKYMDKRQILALVGLRRTGKTTLLYQLIQHLIEQGINPFNILYFSFDEEDVSVEEILDYYEKEILKKDLSNEKVFLFFDEIQKLNNWENKLKILYDLYPKMKIIVSGSASINLLFKGKETLAGRIFYFYLDLLDFEEFIEMRGLSYEKLKKRINLWEKEIKLELKEYFKKPFPEIVRASDDFVSKYIKEGIVERIIIKDIKDLFGIREFDTIEKLIKLIFTNPGLMINLEEVANELGISRQALNNYLYYLEATYLIKSIGNFRGSFRASSRKLKKYYPLHPCFSIAFGYDEKGKIVENLVLFITKAKHYWRQNNKEVDFITKKFPIEVKYKNKVKETDTKNLIYFMKKYNFNKALIITKNLEKKGKIIYMPLWKLVVKRFLLFMNCSPPSS